MARVCCGLVLVTLLGAAHAQERGVDVSALRAQLLKEMGDRLDARLADLREELMAEMASVLDAHLAGTPATGPTTAPAASDGQAYLGISVREITRGLRAVLDLEEGAGVIVEAVAPGSAAEAGGLLANDVILSLDDTKVGSGEGLRQSVAAHAPGDQVKIGLLRRGRPATVEVTLGSRAPAPPPSEDALDRLLDELLEEEGGGEGGEHRPPMGRNLPPEMQERMRQFREQWGDALDTPEGREMVEEQLKEFNEQLSTPEGQEEMLLLVEDWLENNPLPPEQKEQAEEGLRLIEEFLMRPAQEREGILRRAMEMMGRGENPLDRLPELMEGEKPQEQPAPEEAPRAPGFLGAQLANVPAEMASALKLSPGLGVLLVRPLEGHPAAAAGLRAGEVIVAMDGQDIPGRQGFRELFGGRMAGDEITLTVVGADGQRREVKVVLGARPDR